MNCPICNKEMTSYGLQALECKSSTNDLNHALIIGDVNSHFGVLNYRSDLINCVLVLSYSSLLIKEIDKNFTMDLKESGFKQIYESFFKIDNAQDLKTKISQLYKEQIFAK